MSAQIISVTALALVFLIATARPVNMGLLAFAAAFGVAATVAGVTPKEVLANFPGDLFVTLVGITFLFGIAERNRLGIQRIPLIAPATRQWHVIIWRPAPEHVTSPHSSKSPPVGRLRGWLEFARSVQRGRHHRHRQNPKT